MQDEVVPAKPIDWSKVGNEDIHLPIIRIVSALEEKENDKDRKEREGKNKEKEKEIQRGGKSSNKDGSIMLVHI